MGLLCSCLDWDFEGPGYYPPDEPTTLNTKKRKRCISCKSLISVGAPAYKFQRFRYPETEIEVRIYGDGKEIDLASHYQCEECGDQYMNLGALGYCVNPYDNMFDLLKEYAEEYQAVKVQRAGVPREATDTTRLLCGFSGGKLILIPEIETVAILVPRTGSGSLYRAVKKAYPESMRIYRHMEADGVPQGYDRWPKVGVVRNPIDRLWSLYKFLLDFKGRHDPAYIAEMRASVLTSFSDWIVNNRIVFTSPYDRAGRGRFWPGYTCRHPLPENQKSQFVYLRPDLGTEIYQYDDIDSLADRLRVKLERFNTTTSEPAPVLSPEAEGHMHTFMAWDFTAVKERQYA